MLTDGRPPKVIRRRLNRRYKYKRDMHHRAKVKRQVHAYYARNAERRKAGMQLRYRAIAILRAALKIINPPVRVYVKADCPRAVLIARDGALVAIPSRCVRQGLTQSTF